MKIVKTIIEFLNYTATTLFYIGAGGAGMWVLIQIAQKYTGFTFHLLTITALLVMWGGIIHSIKYGGNYHRQRRHTNDDTD